MSELLPVPPELQHLIEKRENKNRRKIRRRRNKDRRGIDLDVIGAIESIGDLEELPLEERRSGQQRRKIRERRKKARRQTDA